MSGIYIHIPFCKQACHYCNFHFSTSLKLKEDLIQSICKEIHLRKDYLEDTELKSIYFGGGTPSLLSESDLGKIFESLSKVYTWSGQTEITLEANPDDIDIEKLTLFNKFEINRLSLGIQSFFDEDLKLMNRSHNAREAENCIKMCRDSNISNLTIDLIYGSQSTSNDMWEENIDKTLSFAIQHISCYCLTIEEKTVLNHQINTNKLSPPDQNKASQQFEMLMNTMKSNNYSHYEISNFALPGHQAVHNTNYWKGKPYLGLGPSAHSYNGFSRSWNIAHNKKYIDSISSDLLPSETEMLTPEMKYNEYIMTGLRTEWGINLHQIEKFGAEFSNLFATQIATEIHQGMVKRIEDDFILTKEGKYFADRIAMNLFIVN